MTVALSVVAPSAEWSALLDALPRCGPCGTRAEVELNGIPHCVNCAAAERQGRCRSLVHAELAERIAAAVSPFEPTISAAIVPPEKAKPLGPGR